MLKKIIIISFILLTSGAYAYSDVNEGHWAYEYINELSDKEILSGYPDNSFRPESDIKRSEFIALLTNVIAPNIDVSTDSGHWSDGAKKVLQERGILKLEEYSSFKAEKGITRLEVIKLLVRSLSGFSEKFMKEMSENYYFTDISKYSSEEKRMINILYELDILNGYQDCSLRLDSQLTRAETTSLIYKFIKNRDKFLDLFDEETLIYENDIAVVYKENLPYELKKKRNSKDINHVTTKINSIDIFKFEQDVPSKYKTIFKELYMGDDLYSKYRIKFGEGKFVLAINISTTNNTESCEIFSGHEFLNVEFDDEEINIIDSFDIDEIKRQKNNSGRVGEKVMPGETRDTSVFYVITNYPKDKIIINRDITGLYDIKDNSFIKESSFNSLIVKLKEDDE